MHSFRCLPSSFLAEKPGWVFVVNILAIIFTLRVGVRRRIADERTSRAGMPEWKFGSHVGTHGAARSGEEEPREIAAEKVGGVL